MARPAFGSSLSSAAYNFKVQPLVVEVSSALVFLGFRLDSATGNILRPDGSPLTEEQMRSYTEPYHLGTPPLSLDERWALLSGGYRIDESNGMILSPATRSPITTLAMEQFRLYAHRSAQHQVIERLTVLLSSQQPDRALAMDVFAQARRIAQQAPGALPPSMEKAFSQPLGMKPPDTTAGTWAADVAKAYLDSERYWDNAQPQLAGLTYVRAIVPGLAPANAPPVYFDQAERQAGEGLSRAAAAYFGRWPLGRELLDHFRDQAGTLQLPPFLVLDLAPAYLMAAIYDEHSKAIVINRSYLEAAVQGGLGHREDLETTIFQALDVTLFHELTHAWQDKRDGLMSDLDNGSAPAGTYLEYEVEAKLAGYRFLHAKLLADPSLVIGQANLADYQRMLADLDSWQEALQRRYLQAFPHIAADLATTKAIQRERFAMISQLIFERPDQHAPAVWERIIKLLQHGDGEISRVNSEHQRRLDDFRFGEWQRMRREARPALIEVLVRQALAAPKAAENRDRFKQALLYAAQVPDEQQRQPLLARIQQAKAFVNASIFLDQALAATTGKDCELMLAQAEQTLGLVTDLPLRERLLPRCRNEGAAHAAELYLQEASQAMLPADEKKRLLKAALGQADKVQNEPLRAALQARIQAAGKGLK